MTDNKFYQNLTRLLREIHQSTHFADILPKLEAEILVLFNCERMTVYQRNKNSYDIVSRYKSGNELKEIRVPIGPQSIAGYVAFSKEPLIIQDPYDSAELQMIHPKLKFASRFDKQTNFKSRNMLVVPIIANDVLLGVLQLINVTNKPCFDDTDKEKAYELASFLGQKFRYELGGTKAPFEYLVHEQLISQKQLSACEEQAKDYSDLIRRLLEDVKLQNADIGKSLEVYYQVKYINANTTLQPHPANNHLNTQYKRKNLVVILANPEMHPIIVMAQPTNATLLLEVESATGLVNYELCVALPDDILKLIGGSGATEDNSAELGEILDEIEDATDDGDISDDDSPNEEAPAVVRLVNRVLQDGKRLDASDIHIDPGKGKSPTKVRMRIDGVCQEIIQIPHSHHAATIARIKILARLDIAEKRLPQDGKFAVKINGNLVEVRVATIPTVFGEGVVMRILASGGAMPFSALNLSQRNYQMLDQLIQHPHGILLVVGPTGSGKTTTLHAVLGKLNTPDKKIWTAEDPVEITQPGLQQVQMNNKIGFDFKTALRAFLRADPDIILIGEMRDRETAHAGVEASLTGHLVLSTLHTNSAPETITRLLDLGLDPVNFSDACLGILAQRLIRTLCKACKQQYQPDAVELEFLRRQYGEEYFDELGINTAELKLYKAAGCDHCAHSGYKGRTGIHELLRMTPALRQLVYKEASVPEMKVQCIQDGMRTLVQDGIIKVLQGDTDFAQLQKITAAED
ncbi:phytochrome sensor protein [Catenovulum agarivorans DS-2]|uniref:Phytochrome sensor protein n=1 Tax=Catenovulum agarivorans DS-2 TaxID=1328313 RepID=W7QN33_9ALTE|nr:ATPase, T2SS/T4P/T4SS family [Catenovulum agarivorans]EWH09303.1 phytochrome sensor protein [Catenovulum agarivorans DS-2]